MSDLTTSETQGDLALVAVIKKTLDVAHLDVVVTVVCTGPELNFLDLNDFLLGLGFGGFFLLRILELAVIHKPTHRRHGRGGYLNKIDISITGQAQSLHDVDNAQGLVVQPAQTHFGGHDFTVQAMLAFFAVTTVTKFSSDGSDPSKNAIKAIAAYARPTRTTDQIDQQL